MRLLLHVDDRNGPPRLVHLAPGRSYVLGRGTSVADIHITEHHVSRRHCLLRCGDRSAWLCDLGSANGTRLDGAHLDPQGRLLVPDDVIHIAGNPVRLGAVVPLDPAWLAGNGGSVVQMALLIDEGHDYAALPILADALEDAACDDADLLTHCRAGRAHTAGCWVIDLLLRRTSLEAEGERPEGKRLLAILSDVHGNLEALQAVLADIEQQGVHDIYCLGDTLGYGPNPRECLELIRRRCKVVLLGNLDQAVISDDGFGHAAQRGITWSRRELGREGGPLWTFLGERPRVHREPPFSFVHGTPRNPLNEFFFPEDIYNLPKCEHNFSLIEHCCFIGNSHVPGVFRERVPGREYDFLTPAQIPPGGQALASSKTLVNVGSVGQPRDGDPRACYVLLEGDTVFFRRIEYDIETTIRKIHDLPDLDEFLGDRLPEAR